MAATTVISRGSSVTTTGSTWASTANAYDGTAGTNTNTYATLTGAASGTTSTIKVSGYNFSPIISECALNSVTVTARGLVTTASRWSAPTVRAYLGTTAIGTAAVATSSWTTTVASYTVTLTGLTAAQILDSTFGVQLNLIRSGGSTDNASVDFLDVTINYGYESWGSLDLHS